MEEMFVTKIKINKVFHLENLEILLSNTERKHLILTGKNGSGKTSVLRAINAFVDNIITKKIRDEEHLAELIKICPLHLSELRRQEEFMREAIEANRSYVVGRRTEMLERTRSDTDKIVQLIACHLELNDTFDKFYNELDSRYQPFLFKLFESKHSFPFNESQGPRILNSKSRYDNTESANENFRQFLVNLRMQLLDSKDKNQLWLVENTEKWLANFVQQLRKIFTDDSLNFVFDQKNFNYNIVVQGREPFNINQLSDGYASFLSITTELIMRMHGTATFLDS